MSANAEARLGLRDGHDRQPAPPIGRAAYPAPVRRGPLRHRWFAAFTGGVALGSVADEISQLALPLLVLELTQSLAAAAFLRVLQFVPYITLGAFVGTVIDRADKRRLLLQADAVGIVLTVAIPLSVLAGFFSLELLYALAVLLGIVEVVRGVATDFAVVPALVREDELTEANAIYLGAARAARIVGPVAGGLAIQAYGTMSAFWLASLAFVPTAIVLLRMPKHLLLPSHAPGSPLRPGTLLRETAEGFAHLAQNRILRLVCLLLLIGNLGGQGTQTLLIYALSVEQGLSAGAIGLFFSVGGILAIVGSVASPRLTRGRPLGATMLLAQLCAGITGMGLGVVRDIATMTGMFAVRQFANAAWIVYAFTPRQREVPAALRGRVNGAFRTVILTTSAASPALLSAIQAAAGTSAALAAGGGFVVFSATLLAGTELRRYDVRPAEEIARAEAPAGLEDPQKRG